MCDSHTILVVTTPVGRFHRDVVGQTATVTAMAIGGFLQCACYCSRGIGRFTVSWWSCWCSSASLESRRWRDDRRSAAAMASGQHRARRGLAGPARSARPGKEEVRPGEREERGAWVGHALRLGRVGRARGRGR
jgi:hypothetical protein